MGVYKRINKGRKIQEIPVAMEDEQGVLKDDPIQIKEIYKIIMKIVNTKRSNNGERRSIENKVAILEKSRMILGKDQQMNEVIEKNCLKQ